MANPSTELLIEIKRAFENNILTSTYTNIKDASIIQTRIIVINDIILELLPLK